MPPVSRPQLIGLDFDGTVVSDANEVPREILQGLQACHAAGIQLAFLTGRRPLTAAQHLDAIGLPALVATNSGCLLWEYPGWRQLAARHLPIQLIRPIAEATAPHSVNFYVDASRAGFEFFYLDRQSSPILEAYLCRWGGQARKTTDIAEIERYQITQVAMPGAEQVVRDLQYRITTQLDGAVLALAVRWPLLPTLALEIFAPEANKGAALAYFAERLGLARAATVAVGDDVNDVAMLEWSGWGIAMPHAGTELRAVAQELLSPPGPPALAELLQTMAALPYVLPLEDQPQRR